MGVAAKTHTVSDFIACKVGDTLTYHNLSILVKSGNIEYPIDNVIYDYIDELASISESVELSDIELTRYYMKPSLLAYDLYGSTELDFVILALNRLYDEKDFTSKKIKLAGANDLISMLTSIYNAEAEYIELNRADLE